MREPRPLSTLVRYFFSRFFENDVVEASGDTVTTVVRALAIAAVPGLMIAFFLQNQYPQRTAWGRIEDHYFFVLYSLLVLAGAAIFEWEMLFPDKLDFLVLGSLPVRRWTMLGAKSIALAGFLALFLFAANVFGVWILPTVSHGAFWRQVWAHGVAVAAAGMFGSLAVMTAGGVLLCVLPARVFRAISPVLRMLVVTVLGLLLVHYVRFGDVLDQTLSGWTGRTGWMPPFWFLGVYERLLHGDGAAPFAAPMAHRALWALWAAAAGVGVTYPLAWLRMQRMAVEGEGESQGHREGRGAKWLARAAKDAGLRAVLPFIGQTMARNSKYQVYLAMYCGTGLALAVACGGTLVSGTQVVVSMRGLHAVAPLLMFWTVAGLRMAFALPVSLPARWVFRIAGARRESCIAAGRVWTTACGVCLLLLLWPLLGWLGLGARALLVQVVCGAAVCTLMVEALMFADSGIPFAQPRSPGRTNLPLMLTMFVGVLPVFLVGMIRLELWLERSPWWLMAAPAMIWAAHAVAGALRERSQAQLEDGGEVEGEFQLLGLGAD